MKTPRLKKAFINEIKAYKLLKNYFDEIIFVSGQKHIDLLAVKNNVKYGINVKSGKSYHLTKKNMMHMKNNKSYIPAFFFASAIEGQSYLYIMAQTYPSTEQILIKDSEIEAFEKIVEKHKKGNKNKLKKDRHKKQKPRKKRDYSDRPRVYITMREATSERSSKTITVYDMNLEKAIEIIKREFS